MATCIAIRKSLETVINSLQYIRTMAMTGYDYSKSGHSLIQIWGELVLGSQNNMPGNTEIKVIQNAETIWQLKSELCESELNVHTFSCSRAITRD